MAEQTGDPLPNAPEPTEWGTAGVDQYVEANLDRFTSDAMTSAQWVPSWGRSARSRSGRTTSSRSPRDSERSALEQVLPASPDADRRALGRRRPRRCLLALRAWGAFAGLRTVASQCLQA